MWLQYSYKENNCFVLLLCKVMKPNGTISVIIPGWLYFTITGFCYPPPHLIYSAPVVRGSVSEILFARFFAPGVDFFNVSNVSIIALVYFFSLSIEYSPLVGYEVKLIPFLLGLFVINTPTDNIDVFGIKLGICFLDKRL